MAPGMADSKIRVVKPVEAVNQERANGFHSLPPNIEMVLAPLNSPTSSKPWMGQSLNHSMHDQARVVIDTPPRWEKVGDAYDGARRTKTIV